MKDQKPKKSNEISKMFHANYLDHRQRLADDYWDERVADLVAEGQDKQTQGTRLRELKKDPSRYLEKLSFALMREGETWTPYQGEPLPVPTRVRADIVEHSGLPVGVIEQLDQGRREPLLSEALAIAYALNIDLASLITPSIEALENDELVKVAFLKKNAPRAHEWLLWVRGLRALPTQNHDYFVQELSIPSLDIAKVDYSQRFSEDRINDRLVRLNSMVSAHEYSESDATRQSVLYSNNPFEKSVQSRSFGIHDGVLITNNVFKFFTSVRNTIRLVNTKDTLKQKSARFTLDWRRARSAIISIIQTLRAFHP